VFETVLELHRARFGLEARDVQDDFPLPSPCPPRPALQRPVVLPQAAATKQLQKK